PGVARSLRTGALPDAEGHLAGLPSCRGRRHKNLSATPARIHQDAADHRLVEHREAGRVPGSRIEEIAMTTMHVPFVHLRAQHAPLTAAIEGSLRETIARGDFIMGAAVERFE